MGTGVCARGLPAPDAAGCTCSGQRGGRTAGSAACLSRGALSAVGVDEPPSMRTDGAVQSKM